MDISKVAGICILVGLILLPGLTLAETVSLEPIRDNTLYEVTRDTVEVSNGSGDHLFIGKNARGFKRRAVFAFDVAGALPVGATVENVTLTLNVSRAAGGTAAAQVHRLLAHWGEAGSEASDPEGRGAAAQASDATWFHAFYPETTWDSPGGDFVIEPSAMSNVGDVGTYTWSGEGLVNDVALWLDDPSLNFGWILRGEEVVSRSAKRLDSRENPTTSLRPQLVIEYSSDRVAIEDRTWSRVKSLFQ